ncbi:MAG TPA: Hsp20/alpha crystallin family protein [Gemmatimonadales bacterium]|jgi:HSP20 family protein|nr:Hsp20/alpha crystallin family protein [Gemmatimonadales bacterium]
MRITPLSRRPTEENDLSNWRMFNRMVDSAFNGWRFGEDATLNSSWTPACDIFEDKEGIKIVAEIPGLRPEDVKLSLENNTLTIRGEKRQMGEEKTERVHRYERSYGVFERSFALPSTVDPEQVQADYDNGLLTITLPKVERAKPREIAVRHGQYQVGNGLER